MVEYLTEPRWTADMQDDREEQSGEGAGNSEDPGDAEDPDGGALAVEGAAVRIDVLDKETGELVDQAGFDVFGQRLHDTKASQDATGDTPG